MESKEFTDRTVLITGGSRGIGFATARAFLEQGAKVAICAQDRARLKRAGERLRPFGDLFAYAADIKEPTQVHEFVSRTVRRFSRIDVLVNNAGRAWSGDFAEQEPRSIADDIDVNVKGVLFTTRVVLPHMLERGSGVIVNISSGAGKTGFPGLATYCATKFAVIGFTESLAQEVIGTGIRVYAVCPGRVATDMQEAVSGKRIGIPPETVAARIVQLAGDRPPIKPGACLDVYKH